MTEKKWVKVMFDYCSTGLWGKSGDMMDETDLPITPELRERLKAWMKSYDSHAWESQSLMQISEGDENITRLEELDRLCKEDFYEGIKIAIEIKSQLPDWTVKIFNPGEIDLPQDEDYNSEILTDFKISF